VKLLLDSHIFLWLLYEPNRLTDQVKAAITDAQEVWLSSVSLWELALKYSKNKLPYAPEDLLAGCEALHLQELTLNSAHVVAIRNTTLPHADPFDALLIAQAKTEGLLFVTADSIILLSGIEVLDAR